MRASPLARTARSATIRTSTPGRRAIRRCGSGVRRRATPARRARASEQDVGACPARDAKSATAAATSSDSSSYIFAPRIEASWRSAVSERSLSSSRRWPGPAHPQQVEVGVQALGRAPRPPHQPLRPRIGLHERQQPLADGLRGALGEALLARGDDFGGSALGARPPGRPGAGRPRAARRGSRCGRSCSAPRRCARGGYTFPARRRSSSASGVRSTSTTSSARATTRRGSSRAPARRRAR